MTRPAPLHAVALALAAAFALAAPAAAQPADDQAAAALEPRLPGLAQRLTDLRPSEPEAYFLLAEEVAQQARTRDGDRLAARLLVLAFELARNPAAGPPDTRLAAAAALALADLATSDDDRRWLRAVARDLDPRHGTTDWARVDDDEIDPDHALRAAETLGFIRAGEGTKARRLLRDAAVRRLIDRYAGLIGGAGPTEILTSLEAHANAWPCPQCRNERHITERVGEATSARICPTCTGSPGPVFTTAELLGMLRFESQMLSGANRSWSAQLAVDAGAPARDPDPAELARVHRVDPARPYFDGEARTDTPPETEPATQTDTPDATGPADPARQPETEPETTPADAPAPSTLAP